MTVSPDKKFYSLYALKHNYKKLQKSKEHIIISADCFWSINNDMLHGVDYEIFKPTPNYTSLGNVYKDLAAAIECNNEKYVDEIIFVGLPWELEEANKYFGDGMLINAYDYKS